MQIELDERERRALRRKARRAILGALESLGGEARRHDVLDRAVADGLFTERELAATPPPAAVGKHPRHLDYELSWALTNLKRDGLVENPARSIWRLAGAAAQPVAPALAEHRTAQRSAELRLMPYREYLRTPEWRKTRAAALLRAGHSCSLDVTHAENLEVHHRTYERRGAELETDLLVLCRECHRTHHSNNGRPGKPEPSHAEVVQSVAPPAPSRPSAPGTARVKRAQPRISSATRRRAQSAVREFVVRLFVVAGLLVGVLMGFGARPDVAENTGCRADACISAGLVAQLKPPILYAFGGVVLGGLVGVALALLVRFDRRR